MLKINLLPIYTTKCSSPEHLPHLPDNSFTAARSLFQSYTSSDLTINMDLSESQTTFPSDSEVYDANYDANHSNSQDSEEQTSHSSSPLILYSPPTFLSILRGAAINLVLPFVNGLMLGFGELFAHEAAFRLGWGGTRVSIAPCRRKRTCKRKLVELWRHGTWICYAQTTDTSRIGLPRTQKLKTDRTGCGNQG